MKNTIIKLAINICNKNCVKKILNYEVSASRIGGEIPLPVEGVAGEARRGSVGKRFSDIPLLVEGEF